MTPRFDVIFMPHKDYHSHTMYPISAALRDKGLTVAFLEPVERHRDSGAIEALSGHDVHWIANDAFTSLARAPDAVVTMNDWDMASAHLLEYCKIMGIHVIGLQEGTTDFRRENWSNPGYTDQNRLPYAKSDFLLLASEFDASYFPNRAHAIIGMGRVEPLFKETVSFPDTPVVLINVNFSYKVCLEFSRQWLEDVTATCDQLGLEYVLSIHPQDETDLSGYEDKISPDPLHELMKSTSLFISRFSNAIYESLALGKPVVYYNPHNERSRFFNSSEGAFSVVHSAEALADSISAEIRSRDIRLRAKAYLDSHLSIKPGESSTQRAADAIATHAHNIRISKDRKRASLASDLKVSILIPAYNVARYIDRCLDSILNQTYANLEVVVINDNSSDETLDIAQSYASEDDRVIVVSRPQRMGVSSARNLALSKASGDAIMWVDPDDWITPDACEKAIKKLSQSGSDVVVFDYYEYHEPKSNQAKHFDFAGIESGDFPRQNFMEICSVCTKIYRRDFIQKIDARFPDGFVFEDWFWSLQWSAHASSVSAIPDAIYFYRRNRPGSITTRMGFEIRNIHSIIRNMELSKAYLDAFGKSYEPLYVLINKSDARIRPTRSNLSEKERNECYAMLMKFLTRSFPGGLPEAIVSPSIRSVYAEKVQA